MKLMKYHLWRHFGDHKMSRNILETMNAIFETLTSLVDADDKHRIAKVDRHIKAHGDESSVCDFVAHAKAKYLNCMYGLFSLFEYKDQRYLLALERYIPGFREIGFEIESDSAVVQGAAMLTIAHGSLPFRKEINSLQIIESCLGIEPENSDNPSIVFNFSDIASLFMPYCIIKLDDSRFPIMYEEDISRLGCYMFVDSAQNLDASSKGRIKNLVLLRSSGTISISILNSIQSALMEYTFLQLYQCLEYLFKLNNCFQIAADHSLPLEKSIDIVLAHELKVSESENLYSVLKKYALETSIDTMVVVIPDFQSETADTDKYRKVSNFIYRLRCNIAHLRYNQDNFSCVDWSKCVSAIIKIIYSVYQRCDSDITQVCMKKKAWKEIFPLQKTDE